MATAATGADAVEYLRAHGVPDLVDDAVRKLIERRHPSPADFLMKHFASIVEEHAAQYTKGATVEVVGMTIDKALNGRKGCVKAKQDDVMIQFGPPIGLRAINTKNCRPTSGCVAAIGDEVQVINMTLAKDINDKTGIVKAFNTKIFVKLDAAGEAAEEMRAVPQGNLKVVQEDASAALSKLVKGAKVEVQNMVIDTSLNGKQGEVKYTQDSAVVKIEGVGIKTLAGDNLKILSGGKDGKLAVHTEVEVVKMCLDKTLNGKKGEVKMVTSKVYVALGELGIKSFPPAGLKVVG